MAGEQGNRVLAVLQAEGDALPLVVIARRLSLPPSHLAALLDDLYDAGLVTPGRERGTVALVPQAAGEGRFTRPRPERAPR